MCRIDGKFVLLTMLVFSCNFNNEGNQSQSENMLVSGQNNSINSKMLDSISSPLTIKDSHNLARSGSSISNQDSISQKVIDYFKAYLVEENILLLKNGLDIYISTDGATSEQISYDLTLFSIEDNRICEFLSAIQELDQFYLREYISLLNYSIDYADQFCKNRTMIPCFDNNKQVIKEICGY